MITYLGWSLFSLQARFYPQTITSIMPIDLSLLNLPLRHLRQRARRQICSVRGTHHAHNPCCTNYPTSSIIQSTADCRRRSQKSANSKRSVKNKSTLEFFLLLSVLMDLEPLLSNDFFPLYLTKDLITISIWHTAQCWVYQPWFLSVSLSIITSYIYQGPLFKQLDFIFNCTSPIWKVILLKIVQNAPLIKTFSKS